jgi:uncharacterized alpha-E superfamily protein
MLCRVADSLFWMSRYIERAENTSRLLDANLELLLELEHDEELAADHWQSILAGLGETALYQKLIGKVSSVGVTEFLCTSTLNPSSVYSSIFAARENARMIRDQISTEMWEVINHMYLKLKSQDSERWITAGTSEFFKQVVEWSHLFSGVTDATFPRRVGYEFIRAGCYLERADKTTRIMNNPHFHSPRGKAEDLIQWVAILKSCTAMEAYQRIYVGDVHPRHVVDFLLHSRDFPRSLLFCLSELQLAVHGISNCPVSHYSNESERLCGKLISDILYSSVDEVMEHGLQNYLDHVIEEISKITSRLSERYMFLPVVDPAKEAEDEQSQS